MIVIVAVIVMIIMMMITRKMVMKVMCRVGVVKHKMDHLACFIPAMLALGAHAGAVKEEKAERYMQVHSHFCVVTFLLLCACDNSQQYSKCSDLKQGWWLEVR